jgi:hypothetical protein
LVAVQIFQVVHSPRNTDLQGFLLCKYQAQNGATEMAHKLPKFARQKTPWHLLWTAPNGEIAGAYFNSWEELESFSRACVERGLCPWVPPYVPTPYD